MERIRLKLVQKKGESLPSDPKQVLSKFVEPDIDQFATYFRGRAGGGELAPFEKEVLRAYLWFKLMEARDGTG